MPAPQLRPSTVVRGEHNLKGFTVLRAENVKENSSVPYLVIHDENLEDGEPRREFNTEHQSTKCHVQIMGMIR